MTVDRATPGSQLKASIADATQKIESIIDDAERAAAEIQAEARAEGERESRRIVSESGAQLAAVIEPLIRKVENLRAESAALMHELETATAELVQLAKRSTEPDVDVTPAAVIGEAAPALRNVASAGLSAAQPARPGPTPIAYPGRIAGGRDSSGPPEEAVLRATQMAVAGSSRSEIEATLSDEFGLADATPVVDDILGTA